MLASRSDQIRSAPFPTVAALRPSEGPQRSALVDKLSTSLTCVSLRTAARIVTSNSWQPQWATAVTSNERAWWKLGTKSFQEHNAIISKHLNTTGPRGVSLRTDGSLNVMKVATPRDPASGAGVLTRFDRFIFQTWWKRRLKAPSLQHYRTRNRTACDCWDQRYGDLKLRPCQITGNTWIIAATRPIDWHRPHTLKDLGVEMCRECGLAKFNAVGKHALKVSNTPFRARAGNRRKQTGLALRATQNMESWQLTQKISDSTCKLCYSKTQVTEHQCTDTSRNLS